MRPHTLVTRFDAAITRLQTRPDLPSVFTLHSEAQHAHMAGNYTLAAERYSQASFVALTQSGAKELAEKATAEWQLVLARKEESDAAQ